MAYGSRHIPLPLSEHPASFFLWDPPLTPKTCRKGKDSFLKGSIKKASSFEDAFHCQISRRNQPPNCASMVPAATAVPITPATFGPIACISR